MRSLPERTYAAARRLYGIAKWVEPDITTEYLEPDHSRDGFYVKGWFFVPAEELEPEPGPTYAVWTAEKDDLDCWVWQWDADYTCDDDPDGKQARASAHEYARYLRNTYPCAYIAVRPACKAPLPIYVEP
jgi:hypothetical protein